MLLARAEKQGAGRASMNSVPAALKKGTPASPAIALARSVLPAPTTSHAKFTLLFRMKTSAEPLQKPMC